MVQETPAVSFYGFHFSLWEELPPKEVSICDFSSFLQAVTFSLAQTLNL